MKILRDQHALVTGAASGIGRAISIELARQGVRLFLIDIQPQKLDGVAAECRALGVETIAQVCDVSDPDQIERAVAAMLQAWGSLQILVNNAGIVYWGDTHAMRQDQWDSIVSINLLAAIRFIHALLPTLRRQTESHILNVASVAGLVPKRRTAAYQTTKFALVGLSQSLRAEYGPLGLGVTALCPGLVTTCLLETAQQSDMLSARQGYKSRWAVSPEYVARHAVRAIRKNKNVVVIPWIARLFWMIERISPAILDLHAHLMHRKSRRRHGPHLDAAPPAQSAVSATERVR